MQLPVRLFEGNSRLATGEVQSLHDAEPIVYPDQGLKGKSPLIAQDNSLGLSVDLKGNENGIGFRAKKNSGLLDLSRPGYYDPG